ncbi:MAG: PAS domain S-box protein [Rhodothermales bacterium]
MNPQEWPRLSELPQPAKYLSVALLASFILMAAAGWLIWKSHTEFVHQVDQTGHLHTTSEEYYVGQSSTSGKQVAAVIESLPALAFVDQQRRRNIFAMGLLGSIALILGVVWSGALKQFSYYFAERRHAICAISDSETINIALLSTLPDTMFLTDADGNFLDYHVGRPSRPASARTAATPSQPPTSIGKNLRDAFPTDIADRILKVLRRALETGDMQTLEYSGIEANSVHHYEVRVTSCGGERALAIVRDITDRESAEQTIREAESKFRILVEQSLTGIYIIQDDRFVYVNPRIAEVFGYTPAELLALEDVAYLIPLDENGSALEYVSKGLSGEEGSSHYNIRGIRKDGSVIYAEIYSSVIEYEGKPAVIGTLLDVSHQREAQEKLRVLGMAVEQSAEGVLVIDTAGIVCFVNPAWARMHGFTVEEVTGHHFRIFHTEEQLRKEVFPVINRFEKTSIYRAEMGHKRKDGSTFMSSTAFASLRDSDGQVIGAVGICRDITEQKQYEAELLAAKDRAEELSRLKTAFLTNMSHEIRTPLTGILGFAKVLEEELPDEQREFAHLIRISGDRLLNTLNSILDLARLEAGEMTISPHELDVVVEVEEAATVFHAVARKKQIQFAVNYHLAKMPARIDRNILNIILNNLVGNAIKFTDEGHVRVDLDATEDVIFLSVSDTGVGIDSKFLPHLFDEFKQESDGLTRSYEGSGLGLSITRRLVHLVNGEINVESAKGKGSRFAVTIPRYIDLPSLSNVA